MGCWPKNGLLDMNKGLSLQHIGRPHSGIGQSLHKSPWQLAQSPACMPQSPGKQRVSLCHSVAQPYGKFSSLAGGRRVGGWREEGRVRMLWFGANRSDHSKHFRGDWNIGFRLLTGGLRFRVLSPIPPAQCLQGFGYMSAYPPPCGARGGCLILFQVCGH